jgi:4a-hydroxytetrahydrobiopterin dehydratase
MADRIPLDPSDVNAALAALPEWRARTGALHTAYEADSVATALEFVSVVGAIAEELDHHPDVDWRYRHVFVRTTTHSADDRVTALDAELARRISLAAESRAVTAVPQISRTLELAIDTTDPAALSALWARVLGYRTVATDEIDLVDPWGRGPSIWFQRTEEPDASRIHLDVYVADETAPTEVEAAAALGARVDAEHAPAWWIVTDVDGNRVCICTNAPTPAKAQ